MAKKIKKEISQNPLSKNRYNFIGKKTDGNADAKEHKVRECKNPNTHATGALAGMKVGYKRFTLSLKIDYITKFKHMAYIERISQRELAERIFSKYFDKNKTKK